jgi:hypothetical protein
VCSVQPPCATRRCVLAGCGEGAACREAHDYIDNPYWIGDQPGGTQNSGWLDAWAPVPSAYFARQHNVRLAVKGGAHSYLGTSTAPDSLLIWTRSMNEVVMHDSFVGSLPPLRALARRRCRSWLRRCIGAFVSCLRWKMGWGSRSS